MDGLPDVPVLKLLVDSTDNSGSCGGNPCSNSIYAGTDIGVFHSANGGTSWQPFNLGVLPAVPVYDIEQNPSGVIFIGTHGRGAFRLGVASTTPTPTRTPTPMPTPTSTVKATATATSTLKGTPTATSTSKTYSYADAYQHVAFNADRDAHSQWRENQRSRDDHGRLRGYRIASGYQAVIDQAGVYNQERGQEGQRNPERNGDAERYPYLHRFA